MVIANINPHFIIQANYLMLCLVSSIVAFIFLRRIILAPFIFWQGRQKAYYLGLLTNIIKCRYRPLWFKNHSFLNVSTFIDRLALENIILERLGSEQDEEQKKLLSLIYEELDLTGWRAKQLKSLFVWKRRYAADILGRTLSQQAVTPLALVALRDKDEDVRYLAVKGLGKLKAISSVGLVIDLLRSFPFERCAVVADILLGFGEASIPYLNQLLDDPEYKVRYWGLRVLTKIGFPENHPNARVIIEKLGMLCRDSFAEIRALSALALANLKANDSVSHIIKLLSDTDPLVRVNAAQALVEFNSDQSIDALIAGISDPDWDVSYYACHSLIRLKPQLERVSMRYRDKPRNLAWERCKEFAYGIGITNFE